MTRHKVKKVRTEKGDGGKYLYISRRKGSRVTSLCKGSGRVIADEKVNVSAGSAVCPKCRFDVGYYNLKSGRVLKNYHLFPHTPTGRKVFGM